jgi:hypothetical protein
MICSLTWLVTINVTKGLAKAGITSVDGQGEGVKAQTFCGTPQYLGILFATYIIITVALVCSSISVGVISS